MNISLIKVATFYKQKTKRNKTKQSKTEENRGNRAKQSNKENITERLAQASNYQPERTIENTNIDLFLDQPKKNSHSNKNARVSR